MVKKEKWLKRRNLFALALLAITTLISCNKDEDEEDDIGNWVTAATFDGIARSSASGFVIGDKGYVGVGYDGDNYLNDFWEYNLAGGYWIQRANFPGEKRSAASSFSIGNYGYIGAGYNGTTEKKDFYQYDPAANSWLQIADFGGDVRRNTVSFNSDSYGYVGCGYDGVNDKKDFWKYDPTNDSWTELFGFGGNKRRDGITFRIQNKVYMGTGKSNGVNLVDFWNFDLTTEVWTKLRDLSINSDDDNTEDYSILRSNAVGFALGNYGYVCLGTPNVTTWEYNPATDYWSQKTTFEAVSRQDAVSLNFSDRAFVLLGRSSNLYLDDMYEFKPFNEQVDND